MDFSKFVCLKSLQLFAASSAYPNKSGQVFEVAMASIAPYLDNAGDTAKQYVNETSKLLNTASYGFFHASVNIANKICSRSYHDSCKSSLIWYFE